MAKMKLDTFVRNSTRELRKILGTDYWIELLSEPGNQECRWFVHRVGIPHGPVLPVRDFYERYRNGNTFINTLNEIVILCYCALAGDLSGQRNSRESIYFQLVRADNDFLQDVPYCLWQDLAVVFREVLSGSAAASVSITNIQKELLHLDLDGLYRCALHNTPILLPYLIEPILSPELPEDTQFWLLTNQQGIDGASCLLYPGMLEEIARCVGGDYWMIPASTHEVLVTPFLGGLEERDFFDKMVQEMNRMQPRELMLADHVYFYDAETMKLSY